MYYCSKKVVEMVELKHQKIKNAGLLKNIANSVKSPFKRLAFGGLLITTLTLNPAPALAQGPKKEQPKIAQVSPKQKVVLKLDMKDQYAGIPIIVTLSNGNGGVYRNVPVSITDSRGAALAIVTTDEKGEAVFTPLMPGKYVFSYNGSSLTVNVKEMQTVSLEEMQKLDRESEKYKEVGVGGENSESFSTHFHIPINRMYRLSGGAIICFSAESECSKEDGIAKELFIFRTANPESGFIGGAKLLAGIDLAPLDNLYKKITGNEIRYVKLVVEKGNHSQIGDYIAIHVVPVSKPDGEIKRGIPVLPSVYAINENAVYNAELEIVQ